MLENIDSKHRGQVASSLKWLAFSLRPLRLDELAEIFILDPTHAVPFDENERLFKPEDVLKYLPGLVTTAPVRVHDFHTIWFDTEAIEIKLAHFSIKEYFISQRIRQDQGPSAEFSINETNAHLHISESCLAYHLQISEKELATEKSLRRFALWEYAALYWANHLEQVAQGSWTPSVTNRTALVFTPRAQSLLNMIRTKDPDYGNIQNLEKKIDKLASPLYYTASLGALRITDLLIKNGADINECSLGGRFGNALQAAAWWGDESVVQLLLDNGANINAQGGWYGNALQAAAFDGNESVVQLLLDKGANINAQGGEYGNALQATAFNGNESVVQLLLDNGADINAQGGKYGNALQAVVAGNELDIARLLLSRGARVDPPGAGWEELFTRQVQSGWSTADVDRLRKFREDPTGFLATVTVVDSNSDSDSDSGSECGSGTDNGDSDG